MADDLTTGRILQSLEDIRSDIKEVKDNVKENRKHSDEFHEHVKSKWNEGFMQHKQWVEQEIKKDREFATREINLLKKKVSSKSVQWSVLKHAMTSLVSIITAWFAFKSGSEIIK